MLLSGGLIPRVGQHSTMPRIEIAEGRYYRGKTSFLRKVLWVGPDGVRWHDRVGPGNCTVATFRSWLKTDVSEDDDPEMALVEAAISKVDQDNAKVFQDMSVVLEDLYADNEITVWNKVDQMPLVMTKFYSEAKGRRTKVRWICWVPQRKEVPAFCRDGDVRVYEVKGKGAFHVRLETLNRSELIGAAFSGGRIMREEGGRALTYMELRGTFVDLGAENDRRLLLSLYNVWLAGYNSVGSKDGDAPFLSSAKRRAG